MKTRTLKMKSGGWSARSVLECGSPLPLSTDREHSAATQSARGLAQSKNWRRLIYFCFLLSTFSFRAWGQSYSIDWYKVAGGGGTSTGGTYSVSGTIGQHDAGGPMTSGSYSLTGGFWSLISVVQTVGAPPLTITHSGNSVKVLWPYPSMGWMLQQNLDLTTTNWSPSGGVSNDGTNNFITITSPTGNLFFRLQHP